MDWTVLIFPVIVVAGWILKQLANNQAEENKRQEERAGRRPRNDRFGTPTARKPPDEIRRFLEEMRRQRTGDRQEQSQQEGEPTAQVVRTKPKPVVPSSPRNPPPRPRTPQALEAIPVQTRSAPATSSAADAPRGSQRPPLEAQAFTPTVQLTPASQIATRIVKPTPPAVKQLLELVQDRNNLGAAFLLREVLDGPVSRRRRRP